MKAPAAPLGRPVICWVTDRRQVGDDASPPASFGALVERVALLGEAGVDLVQVRERDLEAGALTELVGRCVEALEGTATRVLVNDRLDVAIAAGADGVHLRGDSIPTPAARSIAPPGFLVGRSVHGAAEAAEAAEQGGLDYLVLGTIFPSASKPGLQSLVGPAGLSKAVAASRIPVLAIGGITEDRLEEVARTGAAGFAAIGLFAGTGQASALAARARQVVEKAHRLFDTGEAVFRQ